MKVRKKQYSSYVRSEDMATIDYQELVAGKTEKVFEKLVFKRIQDEMKVVQQHLLNVAESNAELTGGDVGEMQKILVDSFLNTKEQVVVKNDGDAPIHFSDLDMFMNSISKEKKDALFMEVFNLFLEDESEKRKGGV